MSCVLDGFCLCILSPTLRVTGRQHKNACLACPIFGGEEQWPLLQKDRKFTIIASFFQHFCKFEFTTKAHKIANVQERQDYLDGSWVKLPEVCHPRSHLELASYAYRYEQECDNSDFQCGAGKTSRRSQMLCVPSSWICKSQYRLCKALFWSCHTTVVAS